MRALRRPVRDLTPTTHPLPRAVAIALVASILLAGLGGCAGRTASADESQTVVVETVEPPEIAPETPATPEVAPSSATAASTAAASDPPESPQAAPDVGPPPTREQRCDAGMRVRSVHEGGEVVRLDDGSAWVVQPEEAAISAAWEPGTELTLCRGQLFDADSGTMVSVQPTGHTPRPTPSPFGAGGNRVTFADGTRFEINGLSFSARTTCPDLRAGDRVVFVSGSPHGACTTAVVENERSGRQCDLWCERTSRSTEDPTRADLPEGDPTRVEPTRSQDAEDQAGRERIRRRIERRRYQPYDDAP